MSWAPAEKKIHIKKIEPENQQWRSRNHHREKGRERELGELTSLTSPIYRGC